MKETMYLVTDIEFDVTHGGEAFDDLWTDEEYQNLKNDAIGLWLLRVRITYVIRSLKL